MKASVIKLVDPTSASTKGDKLLRIMRYVPADVRAVEPSLLETKWWDYRYMSLSDATELFSSTYKEIYREWWERTQDRATMDSRRPISLGGLFENREPDIVTLWKARQAADRAGIPYRYFLHNFFRHWVDVKLANRFPRPNQLYDTKVCAAVHKQWIEYLEVDSMFAQVTQSQFAVANYREEPPQVACMQAIIDSIKRKPEHKWDRLLSSYLQRLRMLSPKLAVVSFGPDAVRDALKSTWTETPPAEGDGAGYLPGCFGLPAAFVPTGAVCMRCPWATNCTLAVELSLEFCLKRYGSRDPKRTLVREAATERKRNQRERERELAAVA